MQMQMQSMRWRVLLVRPDPSVSEMRESAYCLDVLLQRRALAGDAEAGEGNGDQGHQPVDRVHLPVCVNVRTDGGRRRRRGNEC